jgi:hypothetical protein
VGFEQAIDHGDSDNDAAERVAATSGHDHGTEARDRPYALIQ